MCLKLTPKNQAKKHPTYPNSQYGFLPELNPQIGCEVSSKFSIVLRSSFFRLTGLFRKSLCSLVNGKIAKNKPALIRKMLDLELTCGRFFPGLAKSITKSTISAGGIISALVGTGSGGLVASASPRAVTDAIGHRQLKPDSNLVSFRHVSSRLRRRRT